MHSSKLDALLIFQCCAPLVLGLRLFFCCEKNRRPYNIADVAKLSFLAKTRNLMIMACSMCFSDLSLALCCHWDKVPGPGQG